MFGFRKEEKYFSRDQFHLNIGSGRCRCRSWSLKVVVVGESRQS